MNWILVVYLGFVQGYMKTEYPSERACMTAAKEWRELNPRSDATLTCVRGKK